MRNAALRRDTRPIYAAVLALALIYRRRPIVQHLVFASHFVAFVLVLLMVDAIVWKLLWPLGRAMGVNFGWFATDAGSSSILGLVLAAYLVPALRRGYDLGRVAAFLLAPALVVGLMVAILLYRFALFFTVYLAT